MSRYRFIAAPTTGWNWRLWSYHSCLWRRKAWGINVGGYDGSHGKSTSPFSRTLPRSYLKVGHPVSSQEIITLWDSPQRPSKEGGTGINSDITKEEIGPEKRKSRPKSFSWWGLSEDQTSGPVLPSVLPTLCMCARVCAPPPLRLLGGLQPLLPIWSPGQ